MKIEIEIHDDTEYICVSQLAHGLLTNGTKLYKIVDGKVIDAEEEDE